MELWTHQLGLPWEKLLPTDVILAIGSEVQCFALVMQMDFGPLVNHIVIVSIIAIITKDSNSIIMTCIVASDEPFMDSTQ